MFRLLIKNYLLHLPYSLLLIIQMLIVLFITNHTFLQVVRDTKAMDNIIVDKGFYLVESEQENNKEFLENVVKIMGKNCVGYMYRNMEIGIDENDYTKMPSLEYINATMEQIQYTLKEGTWFTNKENQVILGGTIAQMYHAGDKIVLTQDGRQKKVVVAGILKDPGRCIHLDKNADGDLSSLVQQGYSVLLTNSMKILKWAGQDRYLEAVSLIVDGTENKSAMEILKKNYKVTSLEKAIENGKRKIRKNTVGNVLYMGTLLAMAFASVSIQIYMYLRRNREQYQLYRMLGLSNGGIFVLWFGQHIVNLAITTIGFYSIMNYIEKKQFLGGKVTDENTIFFLALYVCVYSVLVGVVYRLATIQLNRKNLKGAC